MSAICCVEHGHAPRLMSPLYVWPYVKVHKTDDGDAEAIAEASTRPTMSFATLKSLEQLDLQALHRARERLVQNRTRLVNQARGFLMERGIRIGTGCHVFQRELRRLLDDDGQCLMPGMFHMLSEMAAELAEVNDRIAELDMQIRANAREDADMRRVMEIPGVGPTIATALVAAIGDGSSFDKARDLSAWLGLVPRQITTGGKTRLIGISKQGNSYLRKLLIHGARTVFHLVRDRSPPIGKVGRCLEGTQPRQWCWCCHGQQVGTDRMGCIDQGGTLQAQCIGRGVGKARGKGDMGLRE